MLNDLFDYRRGADGEGTEDEKSLVNGEISPRGVLCIIGVFLVTASLIGLLIASQTSYAILLVAAAGGAVLVLYSAGPRPIAYTPFGELASGLAMPKPPVDSRRLDSYAQPRFHIKWNGRIVATAMSIGIIDGITGLKKPPGSRDATISRDVQKRPQRGAISLDDIVIRDQEFAAWAAKA